MFCAYHPIPHEDCPRCLPMIAAMRPTVFAELAAAELQFGTECCADCDFVFDRVVSECPRCGAPHPYFAGLADAGAPAWHERRPLTDTAFRVSGLLEQY
jgi:hypothetical protein